MSYNILKDPGFWGGGLWRYLHSLSLTYDGDYDKINKLFDILTETLPCERCRLHSREFIEKNGPVTNSYELQNFVNNWHNEANFHAGKGNPYVDLETSNDMVLRDYSRWHVKHVMKSNTMFWLIVGLFGLVLFILFRKLMGFYKMYKRT